VSVTKSRVTKTGPDADAGEGLPGDAAIEHARYTQQIYTEFLAMEESGLARTPELKAEQADEADANPS
jgi:hypothetical protein